MYKGKFDQKQKHIKSDVSRIVAERNAGKTAEPELEKVEAPAKKAPPVRKEEMPTIPQEMLKKQPAPKKQPVQDLPLEENPLAEAPVKKKKGPRLGSVIFYTLYCLMIFLFFVGTYIGLKWLQDWLVDFEAAQPTTKSSQVYEELFADPDWGVLYEASGAEDTAYEGKEAFVAYMEAKVGDGELIMFETSAGLSGDKKYNIFLGTEKIATFTLSDANNATAVTDIPDWQLSDIQLFYSYEESFRIVKLDSHTVYVNSVPLTDDHTIQVTYSVSDPDGFLPQGASASSTCIQEVTGLMNVPTVTILDEKGDMMTVTYDEATHTFHEQIEAVTISAQEREVALGAIKVMAEWQIKEATDNELAKYFDSKGTAYKSIRATDRSVTKGNKGYSFSEDSVTNYHRYSDTMFSVYVSTKITIHMRDGGTTVKDVHATLLFELQDGKWKVIKMSNADIAQPQGEVRITFIDGERVLSSEFYENDLSKLAIPVPSAPEGKVFVGWCRQEKDENGRTVMTLVFPSDGTGIVTLPDGTVLEPMTLYALYQDAGAANAENN